MIRGIGKREATGCFGAWRRWHPTLVASTRWEDLRQWCDRLRLLDLVDQAKLPDVNAIPESDRLPRLRTLFETLHDGAHPLRLALDKLQTLETVRIIEGK